MISIYKLQSVSPCCLIKQVNKILGIQNLEIWLFDDVSKIFYKNFRFSFQIIHLAQKIYLIVWLCDTVPPQVFQTFRRPWAEDEPRKKNLAFSMTKRTFLRPSDHRGWVLLCFAFYLLSQLIRGTTPTQEVLNSIPSTSSSIHFNTQISFPVAPCARYPIFIFFPPAYRTNGT